MARDDAHQKAVNVRACHGINNTMARQISFDSAKAIFTGALSAPNAPLESETDELWIEGLTLFTKTLGGRLSRWDGKKWTRIKTFPWT